MYFKKPKNFGLYLITDSRLTKKTVIEDAKAAAKAGVKIIQYREKELSTRQMIKEAKEIKKICKKHGVLLIINDRVDVALAVGADGVHISEEDDLPYKYARKLLGKNKIIGLSAHSAQQALRNQKIGADYTSIGPIGYTATKKPARKPIGLAPINQLKGKLKIPLVAIGGINEKNIGNVLKAGAKNIAVISGIVAKGNVKEAVKRFIMAINSYRQLR